MRRLRIFRCDKVRPSESSTLFDIYTPRRRRRPDRYYTTVYAPAAAPHSTMTNVARGGGGALEVGRVNETKRTVAEPLHEKLHFM